MKVVAKSLGLEYETQDDNTWQLFMSFYDDFAQEVEELVEQGMCWWLAISIVKNKHIKQEK